MRSLPNYFRHLFSKLQRRRKPPRIYLQKQKTQSIAEPQHNISLASPGVIKSSTSLIRLGQRRECHLCRVAGYTYTVLSHAACEFPISRSGEPSHKLTYCIIVDTQQHTVQFLGIHYSATIGQRSIAMSVPVCVCVFVCPRSYLRNYTSDLHQIFVHITYGGVDMLCTSGFMDDLIFAHKPRLLDLAAQMKRSAHAALDCVQ